MARSAHAYVRGNTVKFYDWLKASDRAAIPDGPPVWICGDCHVGNLGPLADSDGGVDIQIRDLDQAVIGNPAHDLVRLGLSLAMAARGSDLPGATTARMIEEMVGGYSEALKGAAGRKTIAERQDDAVGQVLDRALKRRWKDLAKERIRDVRPNIPATDHFWALRKREYAAIEAIVHTEVRLHSARVDLREFEPRPGEVLLAKQVLDYQLVDVDGVKVIRASDLYLAPVFGGYRLVGVDVSAQSLLRRLGPARWRTLELEQR